MGTTLTALKAGNVAIQRVLAIEGFPYLITGGATARVVTAWAGTGYSQAIGGLSVSGRTEQALEWRTPIRPVGILTFYVHPGNRDSATYGVFAKAVHKRDAGFETKLTARFAPGDTTMNVVSTSGSPAAPGEIFVGNSCYGYTGKTATTFTGCAPKYIPVGTLADDTVWSRNHRISSYEFHAPLRPVVSEYRRQWEGAWVTVTTHRKLGGVLDTKAEAQRSFAGRIVAVRYDSRTGCMVIEAEHVANYLAETTLLQDQYVGRVREGIYLWEGMTLGEARDFNSASEKTATDLTVVTGAAGTNQVEPGWYTLAELVDKLNAWLQAEKIATRLHGTYAFAAPVESDGGYRTRLQWRIDGAANAGGNFTILLPPRVVHFLGFTEAPSTAGAIEGSKQCGEDYFAYSPYEPLRLLLGTHFDDGGGAETQIVSIETSSGAFTAQSALLPQGAAELVEVLGSWGLFQVDRFVCIGRYVSATEIDYLRPVTELNEGWATTNLHEFLGSSIGRRATDPSPLEVRQIFVLEGAPKTVITALVCSTGTAGYNDDGNGYDILGAALGMAVPYGLLNVSGSDHTFAESIAALPEGDDTMRLWITKPVKLRELLSGDLIIRRAHLIWRNGGLRFVTHPTPTSDHATHIFTEGNKARPTDTTDQNPSDMVETNEGLANHIVFKYSLDFTQGSWKGTRNIEDPESIDALGGRKFELVLPNIHGDTVEALIGRFMDGLPQISRPYWKLERSIDFRFFEDVAPGDVAIVSDDLAFDPATGLQGISQRPAVILTHAVDWGGPMPTTKPGATALPAIGEVTLGFQDVDRVAPFSPAAQVDDTQANAGYNVAGLALTCYAHRYSHATDPIADAARFAIGDPIRIIELDPSGGASDSWDRTIANIVGNVITLNAALAAPAWNTAKRYVIVAQPYASASATQKTKSFEADDADLQVANLRAPYRWAVMQNPFSKLLVHTDLPERYSTSSYGDGVAHDVAHDHGVAILLNNFIDHRSALNSPFLDSTIRSAVDRAPPASSDYVLCFLRRIYVGPHKLPSGMTRLLEVGPWARASSASASKLRLTLSRFPPIENPAGAAAINVLFQSPKAQAEWTGIVSTTWSELTPANLDIRVADPAGYAWVSIELTNVAQSRGCSRLRLKARDEA